VKTARDVPVIAAIVSSPPSVLPDISPTRGEINQPQAQPSPDSSEPASAPARPSPDSQEPASTPPAHADGQAVSSLFSPRVGEMPGRAEGGELARTVAPTSEHDLATRRLALAEAGVEILKAADLPALLTLLATRGISSVLVEGGASVAHSFLDAGLVDRILLFEGPVEIGDDGIESPLTRHDIPKDFMPVRRLRFGDDCCSDYERKFECLRVS
jgi:diaminohydroxyphosphoribosylaminopyrimidine deaminase / 5-amino-6-(5-phosphoribosylamino)uracil reductase